MTPHWPVLPRTRNRDSLARSTESRPLALYARFELSNTEVTDLTGRAERAETTAAQATAAERERADRDRYATELHTLREDLMLALARGPEAAPLRGRIAAALGARARRMARDTDATPPAGGDAR